MIFAAEEINRIVADHRRQQERAAHGDMEQDNEDTTGITFTTRHMIYFSGSANKRNIIHRIGHKSYVWMGQGNWET